MSFMDKAKKIAEQAQEKAHEKFDEVQKQFNERQRSDGEARPEPQPASETPKAPPSEDSGLSGGDPLSR